MSDARIKSFGIRAVRSGILVLLIGLGAGPLFLQGCANTSKGKGADHSTHKIAILDAMTAPNFLVEPAETTIKSGEYVVWANRTGSVIELSIKPSKGDEDPGFLRRLGSKIGIGSESEVRDRETEARLKSLEDDLKEQRLELTRLREQLASASDQPPDLENRVRALEEAFKRQEQNLAELKSIPSLPETPPPVPAAPGFIQPFSTAKVKFEHPGRYIFTLLQSSAHRRSSMIHGVVTVIP